MSKQYSVKKGYKIDYFDFEFEAEGKVQHLKICVPEDNDKYVLALQPLSARV